MSLLIDRCDTVAAHEQAPAEVTHAGERVTSITEQLRAHVPAELRGAA